MIYQCSGCNKDKDDDTDIGTLIGEDYYCEGCLASRNEMLDYAIKACRESVFSNPILSNIRTLNLSINEIESLKGE